MGGWIRITTWGSMIGLGLLFVLIWLPLADWSYQPNVYAPLTRKLLFFHPPAAWASFAAYFVVFAGSIGYLNERSMRHDQRASAAASVGFVLNTIALWTGTVWGLQEWTRDGERGLATVYTEPKVLVVVVLWLVFAAYLLLRRALDGEERRARLSAVFGILGFMVVPVSFLTSRVLSTSLHPDIAGPGANPDAAVGAPVGWLLTFGAVVFITLFFAMWGQRLRLLRMEDQCPPT